MNIDMMFAKVLGRSAAIGYLSIKVSDRVKEEYCHFTENIVRKYVPFQFI